MNTVLIILGILALLVIVGVALRPPHARLQHFADKDADGAPDMSETERREALRRADTHKADI